METRRTERRFTTERGTVRYWTSDVVEKTTQPWMVFLPGLLANHHIFDEQVQRFAEEWNCLVWDAPGHGASRPFQMDFTMDDLAEILAGILAQEDIVSVVLVGHSMGGMLAHVFAHRYPERTTGVVTIGAPPLGRHFYSRMKIASAKRMNLLLAAVPHAVIKKSVIPGSAHTHHGQAQMESMLQDYSHSELIEVIAHGQRIIVQAAESYEAAAPPCPALLLCGDHDAMGSILKQNHAWHDELGIPLTLIVGAGHNANVDRPSQVNAAIATFVRDL